MLKLLITVAVAAAVAVDVAVAAVDGVIVSFCCCCGRLSCHDVILVTSCHYSYVVTFLAVMVGVIVVVVVDCRCAVDC